MGLEALKLMMGIDTWVPVIQPDNQSNVQYPIAHSIDPRTSERVRVQRPAQSVDDGAGGEAIVGHFPQFFDPNRIDLGIAVNVKVQTPDHLLGQGAANTLSKNGHFCQDINAGFKIGFGLAVLVYAFVSGPDADYPVVLSPVKHLSPRELGKNIDPGRLAFFAQPSNKLVQRDNIVAVIVQRRRYGKAEAAALRHEINFLVANRPLQRSL